MKRNGNLFYYYSFYRVNCSSWLFLVKQNLHESSELSVTPLCSRPTEKYTRQAFFSAALWQRLNLKLRFLCAIWQMRSPVIWRPVLSVGPFALHNSSDVCLFHLFTFNICDEYSCMCKYFTSVACVPNGLGVIYVSSFHQWNFTPHCWTDFQQWSVPIKLNAAVIGNCAQFRVFGVRTWQEIFAFRCWMNNYAKGEVLMLEMHTSVRSELVLSCQDFFTVEF